ncbi:MAG TPA: restriction endonuclease subunit S [Gammaproteobacteria bacterium]|nr:restriction endonuclease subunit S [Gammaproteobacteria bacterium]
MSEQLVYLGDFVDLLTGFPFKSAEYTEGDDNPKLLRGDNIAQGSLRWANVKRWPESKAGEHHQYELAPGDIVLAMDRPWIEAGLKFARITDVDLPALLVQRVSRMRALPGLHPRFLHYVIASKQFTDYVLAVQTGTAVPHISAQQIKDHKFRLPGECEQASIATVLGALDDKIELNRRMNETLEAMARAIFKDWFVDFGPTRAKAGGRQPYLAQELWDLFPDALDDDDKPVGWHFGSPLDIAVLISGGTPKTSEASFWDGGIPWASAKDVSQCSEAFLLGTERTISEQGLARSSTKLIPALSSVVVARGATTGRLCMFGDTMAMNQTCYALRSQGNEHFFIYCWFRDFVSSLVNAAHGSVFDTITTKTFKESTVLLPPKVLRVAFENDVAPLLGKALSNLQERRTLSEIRDLLLPKLMSGEIRLRDAEKAVEAVA